MNSYTSYYLKQAQTGVGNSYYREQTGKGVGNFFGRMIRSVLPYLKSGLSAVKDELLSGGVGVLSDTVRQVPIKESLQNRVRNMGHNLRERAVKKMSGSGRVYKRKNTTKNQSTTASKKRKTSAKKGKKKTVKKRPKKQVKRLKPKKKSIKKKAKRKETKSFADIFG